MHRLPLYLKTRATKLWVNDICVNSKIETMFAEKHKQYFFGISYFGEFMSFQYGSDTNTIQYI